jgi:hypothetical protein
VAPANAGCDQDLRYIDEFPERLFLEAVIDAVTFCQNAIAVIGFFYFDERQRHAIDKKGDIGSEFIIPIFAGQFGHDME